MAEGHLEIHEHGKAAETTEQFCSDQILQWWSATGDRSSTGNQMGRGYQEVNPDVEMLSY